EARLTSSVMMVKRIGEGGIPRSRKISESPTPPGTMAAAAGKYGTIVEAHQAEGENKINGRLGPKKPAATTPTPTIVFLSFDWEDSCQRRISRNGAAMRAICFVAPANATIRRPRFRFRVHRIGLSRRKNAHTLSVQLAATKAGKNTKGAILNAFRRVGTSPKIKRIDTRWNINTPSRKSLSPAAYRGRRLRKLRAP